MSKPYFKSSIYVNLLKLRRLLYTAKYYMSKANRNDIGSLLMEHCGKSIECFVFAFTTKDKNVRVCKVNELAGYYSVLRCDIDFCLECNLINFPKRSDGKVATAKIEILEIIGKIGNDLEKWQNYVNNP